MPLVKYKCIVVAVSMAKSEDGSYLSHTEKTLAVAHDLALRLGSRLHIVNAFEPPPDPPWGDVPIPTDLVVTRASMYHVMRVGRDLALERAKKEIQELATRYTDIETQGSVVDVWDPAQGIISEAISREAGLIVVGTSRPSYRRVFRGFSTALSLMAASQVPVLVVPEEADLMLDSKDFRMLITDDLKGDSIPVVRQGLSLAAQLGSCKVEHLHVIEHAPLTFFKIDAKIDLQRACNEEMKNRSEGFLQLMPGIEYQVNVQFGNVEDTIQKVLEGRDATLLVFGRHKTFKFRPFSIGRMTANAMLELKRPVLLVQQEF